MSYAEIQNGIKISGLNIGDEVDQVFQGPLLNLLKDLHEEFNPRRLELLKARKARQKQWDQGELPDYLDQKSEAIISDWKIESIPADYRKRRVEITGPSG